MITKNRFFEAIGYHPHSGQVRIHTSDAKLRILACGSRWGKTVCASRELMYAMLKPDSRYWCVSETYELANKVFREVLWTWLKVRPDFIERYSESEQYIRTVIGSELFAKSANKPESLLAESLDGVEFDEPAVSKERVWQEFLQARLLDRDGWAMFTGTPKGRGWYWHLYRLAKEPGSSIYATEGPTWENPLVSKEALFKQKSQGRWSERYWKQEILGEFLDDTGAVFKNVRSPVHMTGELHEPKPGATYTVGWDPAKHQDWSDITVIECDGSNGHVCDYLRMPKETDWGAQKSMVREKCLKFNNATLYMDASGPGDPVVDDMISMGVPLIPIKTASVKQQLIEALVIAFENGRLTYPDIPTLINELEIFEMTPLEKTIRYAAPEGFHDDAVISLALAWRGLRGEGIDFDNAPNLNMNRTTDPFGMPDLRLE